jgi:hypothetical protein
MSVDIQRERDTLPAISREIFCKAVVTTIMKHQAELFLYVPALSEFEAQLIAADAFDLAFLVPYKKIACTREQ